MNRHHRLIPKYIKFAQQLRAHIHDGEFPPGTALPSQRDLAQRFSTTLMTLRKALSVLEEEGLIRTDHGVGTFVLDPHVQEKDFPLFSLNTRLNDPDKIRIDTEVLQLDPLSRDNNALTAFNLTADDTTGLLVRLRLLNERPFIWQRSFLPPQFAHLVMAYDPADALYDFIRQETGFAVTMAKELLQPVVLTAGQAAHLKTDPHTPAWLSTRLSSSKDGTPLLYDEAILKPENFVVTLEHVGKRSQCQLQMRHEKSPDIFDYLKDK